MDVRRRVYRVTAGLWFGPFASPERCPTLVAGKVTHLFNVSEAPSMLTLADGPFREIVWRPLVDWEPITDGVAIERVTMLHRMVCEPDARVYVHCIAGQNRSPTVLWLYLVACGLDGGAARSLIEREACDAVPGHSQLVDPALVKLVQDYGQQMFLPHPRPVALAPIAMY